jgi:hypothetical protein
MSYTAHIHIMSYPEHIMNVLLDVHGPALFSEGEIHWQMAAGPDSVDVRIAASTLHALSDGSLPDFLDIFERNRELLCRLAALKFAARRCGFGNLVIEHDDLMV